MARATGVEPTARKAAYHQIPRAYRRHGGVPAVARPAKVRMAPNVAMGPSARFRPCQALLALTGVWVEGCSAGIVLPQRQLGVEEGQNGRREDVLEDRDTHEAPDDGRVPRLGHAFGAALGRDSLEDADGGHDGAEQDALHLSAHHVHDGALTPEAGPVPAGLDP